MTNPAATQNKEIDCLSPEAQRLAEARLAAKRAARAEAREIRMKELERQQKEAEERPEKDFPEKGSRNLPGLSAASLASLGGTSSRRGSGDTSVSIDTEASIREIKDSLAEVEEKYKKAMVSNAQLDNEKTNYMYQVDTLKDTLLELEEQLAESRRQYEEKSKELEREKHAHRLLQFQFAEVQAALQQREDMLQKHGITLNSEVTANGETANHLPDAQAAREGLGSLHATGDGTLGRATEVEVKNEIVDNVGESETLQKTEPEQPKEDPVEDGVDTEVSPPGDGAEDQSVSEDSAPSLAANAAEEDQVQSQVLASSSVHEHTEQAGSAEATSAPDAGTGASPQQSGYLRELNSDMRGPETEQDSYEASDAGDQHGASAEKQEPGKQDCGAQVGEVSPEPPQEPAPSKTPEVAQPSSHQGTVPAGPAGSGEQGGTGASRPPRSSDTVSRDDRCVADVPQELAPSAGPGLEAELSSPEAAGPSAGGREQSDEEEDEGKGIRLSSAAAHGAQEATSPSTASAQRQPAAPKEPCEGNRAQQAGEPDSSPRKTKNKKKKNKKKKSPAAAETLRDDQKELSFQSPDPGEGKEDAQAKLADENSGVDTETEAPGNPQQNRVAGGGESPDGPERPRVALEAQLNPGAGDADAEVGQVATHEEPQLPGDALASEGGVGTDGAEGGRTQETEDTSGRVPLGSQGPAQDVDATSPAEGAAHAGPGSDGPAPAGESGDSGSAGRDETRGGGEKDKGKEDCALS